MLRLPRMRALEQAGRAIFHDRSIDDEELDLHLRAADWLLLPYRGHEGSSGVLSAAAAAQRPIVVADHGILGRDARSFGLGLVHDHRSPSSLAREVSRALGIPISRYESALDAHAERNALPQLYKKIQQGWSQGA